MVPLIIVYIHPFTATMRYVSNLSLVEILAKANLSLEQILEDEVAGMAFPVDGSSLTTTH